MFGQNEQQQNGQGNGRGYLPNGGNCAGVNVAAGSAPVAPIGHATTTGHEAAKVYLPQSGEQMVTAAGETPLLDLLLPPDRRFFDKQPRKWTWDSWARRTEYENLLVARSMNSIAWTLLGAVVGLAGASVPMLLMHGYNHAAWQPIGAACGAALGAVMTAVRWKGIFQAHDEIR
ncbi:MAG: hypothetical protein HY261_10140 [Chloroflexi bacterium]|nr:hypothetical protein [Chloroflexota bacterium]